MTEMYAPLIHRTAPHNNATRLEEWNNKQQAMAIIINNRMESFKFKYKHVYISSPSKHRKNQLMNRIAQIQCNFIEKRTNEQWDLSGQNRAIPTIINSLQARRKMDY